MHVVMSLHQSTSLLFAASPSGSSRSSSKGSMKPCASLTTPLFLFTFTLILSEVHGLVIYSHSYSSLHPLCSSTGKVKEPLPGRADDVCQDFEARAPRAGSLEICRVWATMPVMEALWYADFVGKGGNQLRSSKMKCVNRKTYSKMVDFPCVDLYVSMSICLLIGLPSTIVYKMSMRVYAKMLEKMKRAKNKR
jgi:hypothetical protein